MINEKKSTILTFHCSNHYQTCSKTLQRSQSQQPPTITPLPPMILKFSKVLSGTKKIGGVHRRKSWREGGDRGQQHSGTNKTEFKTIISIERSYANCILQVSMDTIIDIFGKRRNCESFMRSVHVLINLLYIVLRKLVNSMNYVLILQKQHFGVFHILFNLDVIGL